jgi:hypothetical protein
MCDCQDKSKKQVYALCQDTTGAQIQKATVRTDGFPKTGAFIVAQDMQTPVHFLLFVVIAGLT